ncbi:MAG TPA: Co2+/Mg2+ efflux protein ApaG [Chitinophagaceae bacterium]|nr:Co2+/Mg2+ efflux protein ApaG [Chitinophagaceae bacterium]
MISKISEGIKVNVECNYNTKHSKPILGDFIFSYCITIENYNAFTVQLLKRKWHIFDSLGAYREVEGDGVVGVQPIIKPGDHFQYVSFCNLKTEIGKMQGSYETRGIINEYN